MHIMWTKVLFVKVVVVHLHETSNP
jgi:hypothetical protein